MGTQEAMGFIAEAFELQQRGARKEAAWSALKDPMIDLVKKAVKAAPKDPDVLFMATWLITPLAAAYSEPKRLIADYQRRLDQLGGPTDAVLDMAGGDEAYRRHRSMVKESAGSGCVVAVAQAIVVLLFAAAVGSLIL